MKRTLMISACVALLVLAAAPALAGDDDHIVRVTEASNGKTKVLAPGTILEVVLEANPSAGLKWHLTSKNDPVLREEDDPEFSRGETKNPAMNGAQRFRFKADEIGSTLLTLVFRSKVESDDDTPQEFNLSIDVRYATHDGAVPN